MVRRLSEQFDAGLDAYRVDDGPGSFARAYVRECFAVPEGEQQERAERLGAALLAAMASEPHLLDPLREAFAGWQQCLVADAPDPVRATIARLAPTGCGCASCSGSPISPLPCATRSASSWSG